MMDKENLRKADIFTGSIISLFGLFIVVNALEMPMKDSYGGVQNVWYVSPALFPLFVGSMLILLGVLLIRTAFKTVGWKAFKVLIGRMTSSELIVFLKDAANIRFYAMLVLFFSYVFHNIPRIDFFLSSILFLFVFITMFYLEDDRILLKLLFFYMAGFFLLFLVFLFDVPKKMESVVPWFGDWLAIVFIAAMIIYSWTLVRGNREWMKKYRMSIILSLATPFIIGPIFKYFLLVPMPFEGLVVTVMDYFWYM